MDPEAARRLRRATADPGHDRAAAPGLALDGGAILVERARLLRRLGRFGDAADAWQALASGIGPLAVVAWIEVAKLREHRLGDVSGAFAAATRGRELADRRRRMGRIDPPLDRGLTLRLDRLRRRLGTAGSRAARVS